MLLSGDIGSGKSSILLGIEFALFGAKSAELPASSLLRHGAKEGSVELHFALQGKDIIIKRTLKRAKSAIKQETGYVVVDGVKKELSPVEMKAEIFGLLGYPSDLVSKNKDLIYRYTVYTPQEELKRILFDDKDTRLDTLRKVFNIDKYKRIRENATVFSRALKEKSKEFAGFISDLEEKKKELDVKKNEIVSLHERIKTVLPKIEAAKVHVKEKKDAISLFEGKIKEYQELKHSYELCEQNLSHALSERKRANELLERITEQIATLEKEIVEVKEDCTLKKQKEDKQTELDQLRKQRDLAKKHVAEHGIIKKQSEEVIDKISKLDECPLCLQSVTDSHKSTISDAETRKIQKANVEIHQHTETSEGSIAKIQLLEKEIEELSKKEHAIELSKLKVKNLSEKKEEKMKLEDALVETKKRIGEINATKLSLNEKMESLKDVNEQYQKAKSALDLSLEEEKRLLLEKTGLDTKLEESGKHITVYEEEIMKKEKTKEELVKYLDLQNWLSDFFVQLMGTMERHVMVQVHREFNELFQEWFNLLIEDETLSVRIDDDFTPVIEQNGYETSVENLSGGEKTSVALSYRLALNKVINDVISSIKTKDILMLDEPTDGFSSEQLDKVRDILNQLDMKQVILVSHEAKIESYVDTIIKVGKEGHVSGVIG